MGEQTTDNLFYKDSLSLNTQLRLNIYHKRYIISWKNPGTYVKCALSWPFR